MAGSRTGALLVLALVAGPAAADPELPDLLFNCRLAGAKRVYLVDRSRSMLFDQGSEHPAQLSEDAVESEWTQPWSEGTRMRHQVRIGRLDGTLHYRVDEIDANGEVLAAQVSASGNCSREKIHPRHFR
jgi:hypothetical protein